MSERESVVETKKFNQVYCPICSLSLNLKTKKDINYKIDKATSEVWCRHCQRWVKFSLDN
jgi:uncharacterized protein YbaR (Trm112 family)